MKLKSQSMMEYLLLLAGVMVLLVLISILLRGGILTPAQQEIGNNVDEIDDKKAILTNTFKVDVTVKDGSGNTVSGATITVKDDAGHPVSAVFSPTTAGAMRTTLKGGVYTFTAVKGGACFGNPAVPPTVPVSSNRQAVTLSPVSCPN